MRMQFLITLIILLATVAVAITLDRGLAASVIGLEQAEGISEEVAEKELEQGSISPLIVVSVGVSDCLTLYFHRHLNHSGWRASGILLPELDFPRGPPVSNAVTSSRLRSMAFPTERIRLFASSDLVSRA